MKSSKIKSISKTVKKRFHQKEDDSRIDKFKLLEFIENNAVKSDFITWLNTQYKITFSEKDDWEDIKKSLSTKNKLGKTELLEYAKSIQGEKDINSLLKDVKTETEKAEKAVSKIYYFSKFRKFSAAIGGATVFIGLIFIALAFAFFSHLIPILSVEHSIYVAIVIASIGILDILAGLLLATR